MSINGVGGVAATAEEAIGTTFDGATGRVTTKNPITPGAHTIFLSIFDQGDQIYDSVVDARPARVHHRGPEHVQAAGGAGHRAAAAPAAGARTPAAARRRRTTSPSPVAA